MVRFRVLVVGVLVLGLLGSGLVGAVDGGVVLQEDGGGGVPLGSDLFDDVPEGHWADEEVGWAVSNGILEGVGGGRFDLGGVVPRWQIVSALYGAFLLAGGEPVGGGGLGSDSFVDVPVGYVADVEVGWAVSVGITRGVGGGRFELDGSVTRAQIVTFLSRLSGLLGGPVDGGLGSDSFVDVPVGHWADEAVGWAVVNGVSRGVGGGRFDLDRVVSRAQIATLLFRVVRLVEESRVDVRVEAGDFTAVSAGVKAFVWVAGRWHHRLLGPQQRGSRLTHPTDFSRRSPTDHTIRVGCGPMAPSSAGATTPGARLSLPTDFSWRSPPDYTIRVVCGPMAPSSAGATTARVRLTHPTDISRRSTPDHTVRVGCGPLAPSSAGAATQSGTASTTWARLTHPTEISRRSPLGGAHSCGLRTDGTIVCWGLNRDGRADPPDGNFTAVSARRNAFVWVAGRWHHRLLGPQLTNLGRQEIRGSG